MSTLRLIMSFSLLFFCFSRVEGVTLTVERGSNLQRIIDYAESGDTLILGLKEFEAKPTRFVDPLCGNCDDQQTSVDASYGFIVRNKSLVIIGQGINATRLVTNAGYGLYVENCPRVQLLNLTITGGVRDLDGNATDGGIVVRNANVELRSLSIVDNNHRIDSVVVGIAGVVGREGSNIYMIDCQIKNNGWDGIALYRGATATITDCVIQDGRGAGIGVTWDAVCFAYRNKVSGYWKGIGAFGTSWVSARNNVVKENLGWGLIATGQAYMDITNNVITCNGNCGVAPWSSECRGRIVNNIISDNGWREQWVCPCVGVWNYGDWAKWTFTNNIVFNNVVSNYEDIWDQTGIKGNLSEDPLFIDSTNFRLSVESPAIHAGDSSISNLDGTVSHIGLFGGPQAPSENGLFAR